MVSSHDHTGKLAFVTGAAGGIGAATVRRLAHDGAAVALADIAADRAAALAEELVGDGLAAAAFAVDVADGGSVATALEAAARHFGLPVTIAVNAAGIANGGLLVELDRATWDKVISTNLTGVFVSLQAEARHMVANGSPGRIVNVASTESFLVGFPGESAYGASKAGVLLLTKSAALELAAHHIRVNAVGPGWVETEMTRAWLQDPERRALAEAQIPLGRIAQPEDVADTIATLLSDDARYVTGTILYVDGGLTLSSESPEVRAAL